MNKISVSVIIPTFNRIDCLKDTINSFMDGDALPDEIIIVDQSTNKEIKNKIIEFCGAIANVKYVFSNIPCLTKARNIGIAEAKNDIIIFSDDDVIINKDTLSNVVNRMKDEKISLIAGLDINNKPQGKLGYLFGTKSFKKRHIGHVTTSVLGRFPDNVVKEIETEWAMGFFFVIRKSLIERTQCYFDENFSSYSYPEDLDFSYRYVKLTKELGYRAIINPNIKVNHLASKEYRIPSEKSDMMYVINRYYIACKNNMGIKSKIAMKWTNFGMILFRIVKKQNYKSLIRACKYCNMNKQIIKKGILSYK